MPNTPQPDPQPQSSASRFGSHYLNLWRACPMKWYRQYLQPHPSGGMGLEATTTAEPLLLGSAFHEGLASWYATGWRDGQYDVARACADLHSKMHTRYKEFEDEESFVAIITQAQELIRRYADHFGPGGMVPEWPELRILSDTEGQPIIEREYEYPLGYDDFTFTARVDALCEFNGYPYVLEHKTSSAAGVSRLLTGMGTNLQCSGQIWLLSKCLGTTPTGTLVNVVVKNPGRAAGSRRFDRTIVTRSQAELAKFETDAIRTLRAIREATDEYQTLVQAGMDPDTASRQVFLMNTQECVRYSACPYFGICKALGSESRYLGSFRPRTTQPDTTIPEESQ